MAWKNMGKGNGKAKSRRRGGKRGDTANNLVDGAATFGRVTTILSTIFFTFISLIMIGYGFYIISRPANAPVMAQTTTQSQPQTQPVSKGTGWGLVLFGLFILICTWVWFYFVWKSRTVAAVAGAFGAVDIVDGLLD
jgi:hypothetical protein